MAEEKKLTYDELAAYANQTVTQAKRIYKENQELVQEINHLKNQINYTEINLAFKVLEFKDNFSADFVDRVVKRLEEVLNPTSREQVETLEKDEGEEKK